MKLLRHFAIILLDIIVHHQCTPIIRSSQSLTYPEQNRESVNKQSIHLNYLLTCFLANIYQGDMLLPPMDDNTQTEVSLKTMCHLDRNRWVTLLERCSDQTNVPAVDWWYRTLCICTKYQWVFIHCSLLIVKELFFLAAENIAFIVQQMRAMETMTMVNNTQCIRFCEKSATDRFFITIFNGSGCYAPVSSRVPLI